MHQNYPRFGRHCCVDCFMSKSILWTTESLCLYEYSYWRSPQPSVLHHLSMTQSQRRKRSKCSSTDIRANNAGKLFCNQHTVMFASPQTLPITASLVVKTDTQCSPHRVWQVHCRISELTFLLTRNNAKTQTSVCHSEAMECLFGYRLVKLACWQKIVNDL